MAKILIVDDEKDISSIVARFASLEDFETVEVASGEEYDQLTGFDWLGDDYMVKPFSPKEALVRNEAILLVLSNRCSKSFFTQVF